MNDLMSYLDTVSAETERALDKALPAEEGMAERLFAAMRYSCFSGGKRLRPGLFAATLELFGRELTDYSCFAAGLEMIHTYSLIHDDLPAMDDDDLRRGRPSCHKAYDEATAILAGDALLTHAFCQFCRVDAAAEAKLAAIDTVAYAAGIGGMVSGQMADMQGEEQNIPHTMERLEYIHRNKTGMLFEASVLSAAILCGATAEQQALLRDFCLQLGMAFQISDDIRDAVKEAAELGKAPGSDERNGKLTYVTLLGEAEARLRLQQAGDAAFALLEKVDFGNTARLAQFVSFCLERV